MVSQQRTRRFWHDKNALELLDRRATVLLVVASLVVGLAIALDGKAARAVNGIAGLLWIAAAIGLAVSARRYPKFGLRFVAIVMLALLLVLVLRPSDPLWALFGFGLAGASVALLFGEAGLVWARVLAGIWLPAHLAIAIGRVVWRSMFDLESRVRTDPPPTAALVPFVMVVAAIGGAVLTRNLVLRRRLAASAGD